MDALRPLIPGSTDTLLRAGRANALLRALRALQRTRINIGGDGGSRWDVGGEKSELTITTPDLLRALPTGAGVNVTISNDAPIGGSTGDIWIQYGTATISTMSAVLFKFEGEFVLNQIFGFFSPADNVIINDVQIFAQRGPTDADANFTLVDGTGTSLGVVLALPAGQKGVAIQPSLAVAAGGIVQAKLTQIGSTEPGGYVAITLGFTKA